MSVPTYYIGRDGRPAWDVVDNFELGYHLGSAWTYIARAGRKTPDPREDLRKAIDHIQHEIALWERHFSSAGGK